MPADRAKNLQQYYIDCSQLKLTYKRAILTEKGRAHMRAAVERPMYFSVNAMQVHTVSLPAQVYEWEAVIGSLNKRPSRILAALINATDLRGNYESNSLYFENHGLQQLSLHQNGMLVDEVKVERWDKNGVVDAYRRLMYTLRQYEQPSALDINEAMFRNGPLCLLPLLGSPDILDVDDGGHHVPGQLTLKFKFGQPTPDSGLVCMLFCHGRTELRVDGGGIVTVNELVG